MRNREAEKKLVGVGGCSCDGGDSWCHRELRGNAQRVDPQRLNFYGLADARRHDPVAHLRIHPRQLHTWHPGAQQAAVTLTQIGESHGIRDGVAINSLLDDFSVHDGEARLWPQTERLKAAVRLAAITRDPVYWSMAAQAAAGLRRYLQTDVPGLWYDRLTMDGQFIAQPAPASSFYHIVCAISELTAALPAN